MPKPANVVRLLAFLVVIAALQAANLTSALGLDFVRLRSVLLQKFSQDRLAVFEEWQKTLVGAKNAREPEKLRLINDFFNHRIAFEDDISVWGQSDYWATPTEFIGQGRGDCEDFSIAKYYSLIDTGIPASKLRLVYVRATQATPAGSIVQAHMVLAYYSAPNADPLVLDNLNPQILPASKRSDLAPVFSFNSAGLWLGTGNQASRSNLSRWQDLLIRARAEGFE